MSLGQDLAPHLPFLRRYGRALTGSQVHGDNFVRATTGTRPEPTFLITKPFQRATVKAAISQALFFDAATVPA